MPKFRAYKEIKIAEEITILVQFTADTMGQALEFNQGDISGAMAEHWQDAEISEDRPYGDQEIETCLEFTTVDGDSLLVRLDERIDVIFAFKKEGDFTGKWRTIQGRPTLEVAS